MKCVVFAVGAIEEIFTLLATVEFVTPIPVIEALLKLIVIIESDAAIT
jgi:hypothetical protein